jgi:hypothetical protein
LPKENKDIQQSKDEKDYIGHKKGLKKNDSLSFPCFSLVIMHHEVSEPQSRYRQREDTYDIYYMNTTMPPTKKLYHTKETSPFITSPPIYVSRVVTHPATKVYKKQRYNRKQT